MNMSFSASGRGVIELLQDVRKADGSHRYYLTSGSESVEIDRQTYRSKGGGMKTEYRVTEVGILLLHPDSYGSEELAQAAADKLTEDSGGKAIYQTVKLEYDVPELLLDEWKKRDMAARIGAMDAQELNMKLAEARALIQAAEMVKAEANAAESQVITPGDVGSADAVLNPTKE